jgi:hypothetical protein
VAGAAASRLWHRPSAVSAVRGAAAAGGDASGSGASVRGAALAGVDGAGSAQATVSGGVVNDNRDAEGVDGSCRLQGAGVPGLQAVAVMRA